MKLPLPMLLYLYLPLTALLTGSSQPQSYGTPLGQNYHGNTWQYGYGRPRYQKRSVLAATRPTHSQVQVNGPPIPIQPPPKMADYIAVTPTPNAAIKCASPHTQFVNDAAVKDGTSQTSKYAPNAELMSQGAGSPLHTTGGYANSFQQYSPIVKETQFLGPMPGQYDAEFFTGNGIHQQESGYLKPLSSTYGKITYSGSGAGIANVKTGSVSWMSPEGIPFSFSYVADEFGFRPYGNHLAVAAPEPQLSQIDSYNRPMDHSNSDMKSSPYETSAPNY